MARAAEAAQRHHEALWFDGHEHYFYKDFGRPYNSQDEAMAAALDGYIERCVGRDAGWKEVCGFGAGDAFREHLQRTKYAQMPSRWPWLPPDGA
jgi:hypothetical protein